MELSQKVKIFSALSDPVRLRLVEELRLHDQACGKELAQTLGISVALASHHTKILEDAGILVRRKEGQFSRFSLDMEAVREILLTLVPPQAECPSLKKEIPQDS